MRLATTRSGGVPNLSPWKPSGASTTLARGAGEVVDVVAVVEELPAEVVLVEEVLVVVDGAPAVLGLSPRPFAQPASTVITTSAVAARRLVDGFPLAQWCRRRFSRLSSGGNKAFTFLPYCRHRMSTHVVRIWLPDRPGALGAVASRIGAVRGDLVGIDILERGAGRAIDELVVDLPSDDLVPLMVAEVAQVDGVDVEDVRLAADSLHDPRLDALETAAVLVDQSSVEGLLDVLAEHAVRDFEAEWAVVLDAGSGPLATVGAPPSASWLEAFLAGSRSSDLVAAGDWGPDDVAWAALGAVDGTLVLGRSGRPFRARERRQLAALARIAGSRWAELRTGEVVVPPGGG